MLFKETPGKYTKFPKIHLQELPDPILLIYLTSKSEPIYNFWKTLFKHRAKADNPDDEEASPLPVGNEFIDLNLKKHFWRSIRSLSLFS